RPPSQALRTLAPRQDALTVLPRGDAIASIFNPARSHSPALPPGCLDESCERLSVDCCTRPPLRLQSALCTHLVIPMSLPKHHLELLSPARDTAIAREAILHGADAVYIGGPSFGARHNAENSMADIAELVTF